MRLTLRTLLAYLDDMLDPAETKRIGQKVAESDAAQELIARIKQVTRRRRLTTPPATGPGAKFDPLPERPSLETWIPAELTEVVTRMPSLAPSFGSLVSRYGSKASTAWS